jgi:hypothetical protein
MPSTFSTVCALGLATAITFGTADFEGQGAAQAAPILDGAAIARALASPDPPPPTSEAVGAHLSEAARAMTPFGTVYLPRGFYAADGGFDLVVHFHGAPSIVEAALDEARLNAVVLTINLGTTSTIYELRYEAPGTLDAAVQAAASVVGTRAGVAAPRVRRLALSAWSAGYGAVASLLDRPAIAERVDAVLLADAMHAGYVGGRGRVIDPQRMQPFVAFALRAATGERLMAVTHSAIRTAAYASTTETADYLVDHAGLADRPSRTDGPRGMIATSSADKGSLHVRGFAGDDKAAHCDQLLAMGRTLFPLLYERWATTDT